MQENLGSELSQKSIILDQNDYVGKLIKLCIIT